MSARSATMARFSNRTDVIFVKVPEQLRPTKESIKKMGEQISSQIRANNVMRHQSKIETSKRICC